MDSQRLRFVVLATVVAALAVAVVVIVSTGGPSDAPRKVKDLGAWKGGARSMVADGADSFHVAWSSGDRRLRLGGPWREIPLVVDVPTGDLVIVCGEPGRYNLQIWKAPEGPFDAKHVGSRRDVENALARLHPGKAR